MPPLILFIDSDPAITRVVCYNLEMEGFEVIAASDGESGAGLAVSRSPDLVILDPHTPRLNGYEVCARIRGRRSRIPIVVVTTYPDWPDFESAPSSCKPDDIILKPFSPAYLIKRVRGILGFSRP
jgi:DNA-binding response OmpR family regulator